MRVNFKLKSLLIKKHWKSTRYILMSKRNELSPNDIEVFNLAKISTFSSRCLIIMIVWEINIFSYVSRLFTVHFLFKLCCSLIEWNRFSVKTNARAQLLEWIFVLLKQNKKSWTVKWCHQDHRFWTLVKTKGVLMSHCLISIRNI